VCKIKWKGIFVLTQQLEPSFRTASSTAVRHTLGIHMPSRNQIQADPAAEHTHDCLLGRREKVTVRAGLAISAPTTGAAMLAVWQWLVP